MTTEAEVLQDGAISERKDHVLGETVVTVVLSRIPCQQEECGPPSGCHWSSRTECNIYRSVGSLSLLTETFLIDIG
jgi:hypothetical protein